MHPSIDSNSYVYYDYRWRKEEGLIEPKVGHRSIVTGEALYHIGGGNGSLFNGEYTTEAGYEERWTISNSEIKQQTQKLLTDRIFTLEAFAVPDTYCSSMFYDET